MRTPPLFSKSLATVLRTVDLSVLERLFDQVPDVAFFTKDREGRYTSVNASLVERHGLRQKSQVLGRRPSDICPGDFGLIPAQQDVALLRSGRPLLDHLELHWYAPNESCWCLTTKLPLLDADDHIVGLIGISRDVRAPIKTQEIPAAVATALDHFEHHLGDHITPSSLAQSAGISPMRFSRLMKRFFGLTPSQYITKIRIAAASVLLRETDQPVTDIALACGYYDHSAFTRVFRKIVGVTPTQFRELESSLK